MHEQDVGSLTSIGFDGGKEDAARWCHEVGHAYRRTGEYGRKRGL